MKGQFFGKYNLKTANTGVLAAQRVEWVIVPFGQKVSVLPGKPMDEDEVPNVCSRSDCQGSEFSAPAEQFSLFGAL